MYKLFSLLLSLFLTFGSAYAADRPAFLVDADWLAERINDPKLVILEVRYYPHRHNTVGHIPGATQVQRFGRVEALKPEQIKDLVALLLDPESPVNK